MENQNIDDYIKDAKEFKKYPPKKIYAFKDLICHSIIIIVFLAIAIYIVISKKLYKLTHLTSYISPDFPYTWETALFLTAAYLSFSFACISFFTMKYVSIFPFNYLKFNIFKIIMTEKALDNIDVKKIQ